MLRGEDTVIELCQSCEREKKDRGNYSFIVPSIYKSFLKARKGRRKDSRDGEREREI